ncbi:MAG TPA: prolyl oligopeptidase family serine peptidase [Pyrinomonadaceae bacterium]|nr:prolyl oligopeptidase family serine peptidase [Pyrinomonadaceae bacterium]
MFKKLIAALAFALAACAHTSAQTTSPASENGKLLEQTAFQFPAYEGFDGWIKNYLTAADYERLRNSPDLELLRIKYASDGLAVTGFIYKPRRVEGRKLPVVFYNRGGIGPGSEIGAQNFNYVAEMYRLASEGFVVLASQYRGYDGAGGRDEAGGADTNDVLNLVALARTLPYVDAEQMFMWGYSRGAVMTLQAIRQGVPLRAAVVVGAPTDYHDLATRGEGFFRDTFPDYDRRKEEHLTNRSAVRWADRVSVPLLILHGGDDRLRPSQVHRLAERLEAAGKLYEMVVYAKDGHPVARNYEDRMRRTVDWFKNPRAFSIVQTLRETIEREGAAAAVKRYHELRRTQPRAYDFSEGQLNALGYELLATGRATDAVEIFKLNVEMFPQGFNTYDSLGEAYAAVGNKELAIKNYRKSLELNPRNTNAVERLKRLEGN